MKTMDGPLVSILMPSYNAEDYIIRAVESILGQTYTNIEILLMDDASQDQTYQLISRFKDERIRIYRNPENIGYLRSCNLLFREAKGDLITFQDSDDWSFPTRIEKQVHMFMIDPEVALCATGSRTEVTIDGFTIDSESGISTDQEIKGHLEDLGSLPFTCATIMVKREVLNSVGLYREFFDRIGAEHVDWAYMICEKFKCAMVGEVLYYYTFNPGSFTKQPTSNIRKRKSLALAKFLHDQRVSKGIDDLQSNQTENIDRFIRELEKPYKLDRTLLLREDTIDYLNKRMYGYALTQQSKAILKEPTRLLNWTVLLVVLMRSLSGFIRILIRILFKRKNDATIK